MAEESGKIVVLNGKQVRVPADATVAEIEEILSSIPAETPAQSTPTPQTAITRQPLPGAKPQPEELSTAQKIVRGGALSMAGGAIGGAVGALPPVMAMTAGIVNPVTGTMAGSAAGEAITQYFDPLKSGVEEPSKTSIALAGALPMVPAAARRFFISLPGAATGLQDFLLKRLGQSGEKLVNKFAPLAGKASELFEQAKSAAGGVAISTKKTLAVATEMLEEAKGSAFGAPGKMVAKQAERLAQQGNIPYDIFRVNQSDLGAIVRGLETKGGPGLGRAKAIYKSMWADMDDTLANTPGEAGVKLKEAIGAFKQEEAAKFIKNAFVRSTTRKVGERQLQVDSLLSRVDKTRDVLDDLLGREATDDLLKTLKPYSTIPVSQSVGRTGIESVPFAQRTLMGALAGGSASFMGLGTEGAVGSAVGGILAVEAVSWALTTGIGRKFVQVLAEHGLGLNQIGNILLQGIRAGENPTIKGSKG